MRLALLALLAACHPTLSAGYDLSPHTTGPLAPMTGDAQGATYTAAVGGRINTFSLEVGVHAHDVSSDSFSVPNPITRSGPHYLTGSTSLDFGMDLIKFKHFAWSLHAGPSVGGMLDRMTGGTYAAQGFRFGAQLSAALGPVAVYVDASETRLAFDDGPAMGNSTLSGVTVGLSLR